MKQSRQFNQVKSSKPLSADPISVSILRGLEFYPQCSKLRLVGSISFGKLANVYTHTHRFTSPDGRCYAFDPRASGYGRGEGVAAVVIKPLSAALAEQNTIRGVIRGTGVSSDGRTAGITLPSVHGQIQALQMAYTNAGLDPSETFYVEAHGE